ncbi:MAG: dihydrofolate reductase [Cytophagales bacterium]|nr:dihydrofolate reductase [Cytophagales bacterium]
MTRPLTLYIAMSLDGYIAGPEESLDFLSKVEVPGEDYGYADFGRTVDTVIWGRRTFDKVLSFGIGLPHTDKKVYVISRSRSGQDGHATYHPDVVQLVQQLKSQQGSGIYCDGGAEVVFELLKHRLIDRLIISIIPHLLGGGTRLFKPELPDQDLALQRSVTYPSGLVQLCYDVKKTSTE